MNKVLQLTAVIEREGDGYVSTCQELDIVSQGDTVEKARVNLVEAVEAALKLDPENGAVHREASRLYLQVGLRTKAERHLQEALSRIPEDGDVQKLAAELRPPSENKGFLGGLFGRKG